MAVWFSEGHEYLCPSCYKDHDADALGPGVEMSEVPGGTVCACCFKVEPEKKADGKEKPVRVEEGNAGDRVFGEADPARH